MACQRIYLISQILIQCLLFCAINARTNDDVINDFSPVFAELHQNFSSLQAYAHPNSERLIALMQKAISDQNDKTRNGLVHYQEEIKKRTADILHESGMDQHLELVKSCLDAKSFAVNELTQQTLGGLRVCVQVGQKFLAERNNETQSFLEKLNNEHYILEVTRSECRKLGTPFDVQTCLIRDLYLFYPSYLPDVKQVVERTIGELETSLGDLEKNVGDCAGFVRSNMGDDTTTLLDNFKNCVYAIIP